MFPACLEFAILAHPYEIPRPRLAKKIIAIIQRPELDGNARKLARMKRHAEAVLDRHNMTDEDWAALTWQDWLRIISFLLAILMFL